MQHSGAGPIFGASDLYISNECNKNKDSAAYFPDAYNSPGSKKLTKGSNDGLEEFCGAKNGQF